MKDKKILIVILIVVGVLLLCGCCSVGSYLVYSQDGSSNSTDAFYLENDSNFDSTPSEEGESVVTCDSSTDDFQKVYRTEEVTIINNPCDVIWLLAQEEESYTMKTKSGDVIYVTVWRDWENNTQAGTTFTIRAIDVEDSGIGFDEGRENASVLITRWVENESDIAKAKAEVKDAIESL